MRVRKRGKRTYRKPFLPSPDGVVHLIQEEHKFHEESFLSGFRQRHQLWRLVVLILFDSLEWCRQVFFDKSLPEVVHHL